MGEERIGVEQIGLEWVGWIKPNGREILGPDVLAGKGEERQGRDRL